MTLSVIATRNRHSADTNLSETLRPIFGGDSFKKISSFGDDAVTETPAGFSYIDLPAVYQGLAPAPTAPMFDLSPPEEQNDETTRRARL